MRASHRAPISVRSAPVAAPRPPLHTHAYRTAHHEPPARTQDKKTTQDAAPGPKYTLTDGFGVQVRWPAATPHATPQPSPTSHHCAHTVANHPSPPPTRRCPTCRSNRTCPAESQASSARASARPPRGSWCAPLTIPDSHAFLEPKSLKVRARALSLRLHLKESPTLGLTLTQACLPSTPLPPTPPPSPEPSSNLSLNLPHLRPPPPPHLHHRWTRLGQRTTNHRGPWRSPRRGPMASVPPSETTAWSRTIAPGQATTSCRQRSARPCPSGQPATTR